MDALDACRKKKRQVTSLLDLHVPIRAFSISNFHGHFFLGNLLRAVVLGGTRLQENRGGASFSVGGAPLYAPPLHPQLLPDFFDFSLQQAFLCFQPLLLSLPETAVPSPVEPEGSSKENHMKFKP